MPPKSIEYNRIFEVVREQGEWFLSERRHKNNKNSPVFDLHKGNWCSIEKSRDNKWLILFYKNKDSSCYKSFAKNNELSFSYFFTNFNEMFKDGSTGQWISKK